MIEDWVRRAAKEVASSWTFGGGSYWTFGGGRDSYVTDEQRAAIADNIVTIIRKHCPFEPDTAYVKVTLTDEEKKMAWLNHVLPQGPR